MLTDVGDYVNNSLALDFFFQSSSSRKECIRNFKVETALINYD